LDRTRCMVRLSLDRGENKDKWPRAASPEG
jgi:hypothetical protein